MPPSLTAAVLAATVGLAAVPLIVIVFALPVVTESTKPLSIPATYENIVPEVTKSVEPSVIDPVVIDNVGTGPDELATVS